LAGDGGSVTLLVSTKKGLWTLRSDAARASWRLEGPSFLGHIVNHAVLDPRDGRTLLAAARTGHLGPTLFRSSDAGRSWQEAKRPPAFPKARDAAAGRAVSHTFALVPGPAGENGVWYAGTSPEGLFRSEDAGESWAPIAGFNDSPWAAAPPPPGAPGPQKNTPDGDILHSIAIDPRDPEHLYVAQSANAGGVFESLDGGASWRPLNRGCVANFLPDPHPEVGYDPHCLQLHPLAPDRLWQQNHCGIYRLERPGETWERVGDNMPRDVGDIGFPIGLHPRDADTAWVFPMDGSDVWPRISPGGRPAVYRTRDAGASWQRCDRGLPREQAWYTVLRQGMALDARDPLGVYFAATCGEIWGSRDEGEEWRCLASHLPFVLALEAAEAE
jgi:photosystem II stability/assembly factor-like uncharacterized protein